MNKQKSDPSQKACCMPARDTSLPDAAEAHAYTASDSAPAFERVAIPGGLGHVGTDAPLLLEDGEHPLKTKQIKPFLIGATAVANRDFAAFVEATNYVTEAERLGWSFVFWSDVPDHVGHTYGVKGVEWWRRVDGANWYDILGPGTREVAFNPDHPAVHISWSDAKAFCAWAGGRLPTEAEWEHAARGALGDVRFPWGDQEPDDTSVFPCNIWQGSFPNRNTGADGWTTTAPVKSYTPNAYGLYNMVGNVWEWTADAYKVKSMRKSVRKRMATMRGYKLLKGGSFLCHRSYCYRYRIAARSGNSPDSTTTHQGFRVVWDAV